MADTTREEALGQIKSGRLVRLGGYAIGNEAELDHAFQAMGRGDEVPERSDEPAPAETSAPTTPPASAPAIVGDGLEGRGVNVEYLRKIAKDEGLDLGDDLKTKAQMIDAIRAHRAAESAAKALAELAARPIEDLRSIAEMDEVEHDEDATAEQIAGAILAKRAGAGAAA